MITDFTVSSCPLILSHIHLWQNLTSLDISEPLLKRLQQRPLPCIYFLSHLYLVFLLKLVFHSGLHAESWQGPAMSTPPDTNECDGCGQSFPLRQAEGDCLKCVKLQPHTRDSPEYSEISVSVMVHSGYDDLIATNNSKQWPQCSVCGVTRRNMSQPRPGEKQTCGGDACAKNATTADAQATQVASEVSPSSSFPWLTIPCCPQLQLQPRMPGFKTSPMHTSSGLTKHVNASDCQRKIGTSQLGLHTQRYHFWILRREEARSVKRKLLYVGR